MCRVPSFIVLLLVSTFIVHTIVYKLGMLFILIIRLVVIVVILVIIYNINSNTHTHTHTHQTTWDWRHERQSLNTMPWATNVNEMVMKAWLLRNLVKHSYNAWSATSKSMVLVLGSLYWYVGQSVPILSAVTTALLTAHNVRCLL